MKHFNLVSTDRQNLLSLLPLHKPLSLFVETTNICNFRCVICIHGSENTRNDLKPFRYMDMDLFKKILTDLQSWEGPKLKLLRLAFHGEPFIQKNFCDYAKYAVNADIAERVDTFSNGSLMDKAQADALLDSGLHAIRFSIYSVINERHAAVTKNPVPVEQIRDNIKYLREERDRRGMTVPYIFVKAFDTYSEENELFFKMYRDIADRVDLEKVHNATNYKHNNLIHNYYNNAAVETHNLDEFTAHLHQMTACPRPFMNMAVTAGGDCVMCSLDAPRLTAAGNVSHQTLQEIWRSDAAFQFRKMQLEGRRDEHPLCRGCDWFKLFPQEDCVDGFPVERLHEF